MVKRYKKIIEEKLKPKRFKHSLNVADSAVELAKKYGEDVDKSYICGLLHDVMKNSSSDEQLAEINKANITLSELESSNPKLWHAYAGSAYMKCELDIKDEEMLSAVYYHTTARANMSMLEKIIYIADYISDDRDYPGVDEMRRLAFENIDKAVLEGTRFSITDLANRHMAIHPDTVGAFNDMCTKLHGA